MSDPKFSSAQSGAIAAFAAANNLNIADVIAGAKRFLPMLKTVAALTPTKIDDAFVAFLEVALNSFAQS